jgi:hypothetical protein
MSRPHVTVRYFAKLPVPDEYDRIQVEHIDLVEPASFGLTKTAQSIDPTVYIRCDSEDLAPLEHKPHYPASEFHITLYEGKSKTFAIALLEVLKTFDWNFRVPLPSNTQLTRIQVKRHKRDIRGPRTYSPLLTQIYYEATSEHLSWPHLVGLSNERRLELCRAVCNHLHMAAVVFQRVHSRSRVRSENNETKGDSKRSKLEIHLTPPELARAIAAYTVSLLEPTQFPIHFGDPAVGTGVFFSALLQVAPSEQIASALGIDVSAQQVTAAQQRWAHKGMEVLRGDYLHMEQLPPRTLILANPPYLRHQRIPSKYKQQLRERASVTMGIRISALSGQYVYFLLLSHAWMSPGAVAAWLIPSEFMQTTYGAVVRHYLTHRVQLVRVHQFGHEDAQFENAMVLPAVVVFRNAQPPTGHTAVLSAGGSISAPITSRTVPVEELRHASKCGMCQEL